MKKFILIAFLVSICSVAFAQEKFPANKISQVIKNFGENINIGIQIQDAKTHKILYQKNSDRYFIPASNEKLYTAFSALKALPRNFIYSTQLFLNKKKIQNGILDDNIYLKFSGDPTFTFAQLDNLIKSLSGLGIYQINGKIILDGSIIDDIAMSVGTSWEDQDFCWGSPISTFIIDENCVTAQIKPAVANQPAKMILPDHPQYMEFVNHVMTRNASSEKCTIKTTRTGTKIYSMEGCIQTGEQPLSVNMATDSAQKNIQFLLTYLLSKYKVNNFSTYEFRKNQTFPDLVSVEYSKPVRDLVTKMLKDSNNHIANILFKTLGANYSKQAGSFQNGSEAVRKILANSADIQISKYTLIDGDGSSRYDFIMPKQTVKLLQKIYDSNDKAYFISALPISGVDGTLKDRFKDKMTLGKIHAKTGTATGVTTLSGYLDTKKNHTLIFSIMINGFVDLPSKYKVLEDQLCKAMIKYY